jgi:O-glycosyl hydrolase
MSDRLNRREFAGLVTGGVAALSAAAPMWAHVAFVNPDGTKTVVLSNTGATRKMQLRLGSLMTEVALPANSVTNLNWV